MPSLSSINIKFSVDLEQFSTAVQNASRELKKTGAEMQKIGSNMSMYITAPIIAAGGVAIKFASDYEESLNKVNVAFGNSASEVEKFGDTTLDTFGIAKGTALDMAALFGDMATSMGLPQNEASKMATSLVGLAGDLASFKNIGIDQATTALNGVFTGETESLKTLGVVMTEANLQQFAYSKGIKKKIQDLSQAEKVQLRYAYVMSQTTNAQGDFARTGGGAANQMRIFQESLKEISVQFGTIILPLFTKVITAVNQKIKAFGALDEGTKKVIVIVAALAASIGPLLYGFGAVASFIPKLVNGFTAMQGAFAKLSALIASNPYTAAAVAIGLLVAGIYAYIKSTNSAINVTKLYSDVREEAAKSVVKEKIELDSLVKIAQNEQLSKEKRQAAIKKLNEISPEYLGNLELETINTDAAKAAIDRYNQALNKKALQQAVLNKKTELTTQLIELQSRDLAMTGNAFSDASQKASDYIFSLLGVESNVIRSRKELENYIKTSGLDKKQAEAVRLSYAGLLAEREKSEKSIKDQISALDKFVEVEINASSAIDGTTDSTKELNDEKKKLLKSGTIAFYEAEIGKLREQQKEVSLTSDEYVRLGSKIAEFQEKINSISTEGNFFKEGTAPFFEKQISDLKEIQSTIATTNREWLLYQQRIDEVQVKLDGLKKPLQSLSDLGIKPIDTKALSNSTKEYMKIIRGYVSEYELEKQRMDAINEEFGAAMSGIIESAAENLAIGFGQLLGAIAAGAPVMQTIYSFLMNNISSLMEQLGKAAIQIGITMSAIKASFSTPGAAIVAGVALIALSSLIKGLVPKEFNGGSAPAFANGGIVPGNSFYGDKIWARLNSGELVLNGKQQQQLWGMMNGESGGVNVALELGTKISGSDIELVVERAINRNNRKR